MRKIFPALLALGIASAVLADNYKILQMNTDNIMIGHRICKKGDVFSDDSVIFWSKDKQAFKAQNMVTKEIRLFAEPAFRAKGCKTVKDYYLKTNHLSARFIGLSELSEVLEDTFYLLDTIQIESPIPLDYSRRYYVKYQQEDKEVRKELPSLDNHFLIVRSLFGSKQEEDGEIMVSVFFSSDNVAEDYPLADTLKIVLLPDSIE